MTKVYNRSGYKLKRKELRSRLTEAEKILWSAMRNKQIEGIKFVR